MNTKNTGSPVCGAAKKSLLTFARENKVTCGLLLLLAVVCAVMLRERYLALVLSTICIYTMAVTGLDILFGYTGQVSFGHAGFFAIGAYGSTLLSMRLGIPPALTVLLGATLALIFGVIIAFPASKLVKHFLSLLTIAFGQMVYIFISVTDSVTNGYSGIIGIPDINLFGLTFKSNQEYFFLFLAICILILIFKRNIINSRIGRAFIAVRENPHAAAGMGINVRSYKILAFGISAFLAGLAGACYAHLIGFISPDTFMNAQSNLFMTMLLFGGIATIAGPVVGAAILVIVTELMQSFVSAQMLIYAFFILVVLFFLPNGVVGIWDKARANLCKRAAQKGR